MTTIPAAGPTPAGEPFSLRFVQALVMAAVWHRGQLRKYTNVPYVSHLMLAAGMVLEDGADEDEAIAALLHDSIEDTSATVADLTTMFGKRVAAIVTACTDDDGGDPADKQPWWTRKVAHIVGLAGTTDIAVCRVSAADKLANLRSLLNDAVAGAGVWRRFKAGLGGTAWYFETLGPILVDRLGEASSVGRMLGVALDELCVLVEQERARLGDAVGEVRRCLESVAPPTESAGYDPWPSFALDLVHRAGGRPLSRVVIVDRWCSWFAKPLKADEPERAACVAHALTRPEVTAILAALGAAVEG